MTWILHLHSHDMNQNTLLETDSAIKTFIISGITTVRTPLSLICFYLLVLLSLWLFVSLSSPAHSLCMLFFYLLLCFIISPSHTLFFSRSLSLGIRHSKIFLWHVVEVITPSFSLPHSISLIFLNLPAQSEVRISFSLSLINLLHLPLLQLPPPFSLISLFLCLSPSLLPDSPLDHPHQLLS